MKAVDTNILVRSIIQDDGEQSRRADLELRTGTVLISHTVLMETEWVLRSSYRMSRRDVNAALSALLAIQNVVTDDPDAIDWALRCHAHGADFADMVHLAFARAADEFVTFDQRLANGPIIREMPVRLA